jgi:hypothetical protein
MTQKIIPTTRSTGTKFSNFAEIAGGGTGAREGILRSAIQTLPGS